MAPPPPSASPGLLPRWLAISQEKRHIGSPEARLLAHPQVLCCILFAKEHCNPARFKVWRNGLCLFTGEAAKFPVAKGEVRRGGYICSLPQRPAALLSQMFLCVEFNLKWEELFPTLCRCLVAQPCPTLCNPMDCSPLGSSVHGISQARTLEWVSISFSRSSTWPRDQIHVSCIGMWILSHWSTWETLPMLKGFYKPKHIHQVKAGAQLTQITSFPLWVLPLDTPSPIKPCFSPLSGRRVWRTVFVEK